MDLPTMDLHTVVDGMQTLIVHILKDRAPSAYILLAKDRVDESTILRIPGLIDQYLEGTEQEIAREAYIILKEAVDKISVQYMTYAQNVGRLHGKMYRVAIQDSNSLAPEALYKAALRFAPQEGSTPETRVSSFSAYTSIWVRQNIQRAVPKTYTRDADGRSSAKTREVLSLDGLLKDGETTTRIEQVTAEDTLWGGSSTVVNDDEVMETLRQTYCDHLTTEEMMALLNDPTKAEELMQQLENVA